jgi:branched-chain amino acid transport system substrate-binding protein
MRAKRMATFLAIAAATSLLVAACGGGSSGGGGTTGATGATGSTTIKLGLLADLTGPSAPVGTGVAGVKAYVNYINAKGGIKGQKLAYVTADAQSTPGGALAGAQKLVQQDKVFAVLNLTSDMYAAEPFLLQSKVPVVGFGFDGPEWNDQKNTNMFDYALQDFSKVYSVWGQFFKSQGGTACASLGYSDSPSSSASAANTNKSCVAAGLTAPYLADVKFDTTDVGPIALAIQKSGADSVYLPIEPQTGFGIAAVLQELGVHMKSILFADGYGGDLLSSPAGVKAAQGYSFVTGQTPVELNTPATQLEVKNLAAAGVNEVPTFGQTVGYLSAATFAAGLNAAPANATPATFMTAMRGVTGFTGEGLLPGPVNFADYSPATDCFYGVKLEGKKFIPLQTKPFCGGVVGS